MVKNMHNKIDKSIIITSFIFMILSIISIYSAEILIGSNDYFFIKQLMWYVIGYIIIYIILKIKRDNLYNQAYALYFISNLLLLILLLVGKPINESKCWFQIAGIGTIQPSEFVKIILILLLSKECSKFRKKYNKPSCKEEFKFLIKILLLVSIPSILTFLEPDTGVVFIYLIITLTILFISSPVSVICYK